MFLLIRKTILMDVKINDKFRLNFSKNVNPIFIPKETTKRITRFNFL